MSSGAQKNGSGNCYCVLGNAHELHTTVQFHFAFPENVRGKVVLEIVPTTGEDM